MAMHRPKGRGRGVLALTSFEPCPRPSPETVGNWHDPKPMSRVLNNSKKQGYLNSQSSVSVNNSTRLKIDSQTSDIRLNGDSRSTNQVTNKDVRSCYSNGDGSGTTNHVDKPRNDLDTADMIAKYNYVAKPGAPGGFEELSIKQGEKLALIRKGHDRTNNPHWWEVRNEEGKQGYVPANRCYIIDKVPTALPWLENKRLMEEEDRKKIELESAKAGGSSFGAPPVGTPTVKTYVSAYADKNAPPPRTSVEASKQYYCDICDKNLNGPQPYKMHMSSKNHREEVEYQNSLKQ